MTVFADNVWSNWVFETTYLVTAHTMAAHHANLLPLFTTHTVQAHTRFFITDLKTNKTTSKIYN